MLLLAACDPLSDFHGLSMRVHDFYRAEQSADWDAVYSMRAPEFRWGVSRAYFVKAMREDSRGWELRDFKILDFEELPGLVRVRLRFDYRITDAKPEWRARADAQGRIELEDVSDWVLKDGDWFCRDAGIRLHLPMSDALD